MNPFKDSLTSALAITLLTTAAHAGLVTWGAPTTISGDSDVSTNGTFIAAVNWGFSTGNPTTTVNGVTFPDTDVTGPGSSGPFSWTANSPTTFFASGHPGLSSSYRELFRSWVVPIGSGLTLTLSGLSRGTTYEFQWWSDVNGQPYTNALGALATATAGNSVTLDSNTTDVTGGLGQYVIGTFMADGPTQDIAFTHPANNNGSGAINAFQLRKLAVPEPGTALFGLALSGAALTRRKRCP